MKVMIKSALVLTLLALGLFNGQCSSSKKMSGGVQTTTHGKTAEAVPEEKTKVEPKPEVKPDPEPEVEIPPVQEPEPKVEDKPVVIPKEQEQINDCSACLVRAKELSATLGYEANKDRSMNFGFYKVNPSFGLCDIHFLKNLSDEIEDHDGASASVLKTQIVLYCPCSCGWVSSPFGF